MVSSRRTVSHAEDLEQFQEVVCQEWRHVVREKRPMGSLTEHPVFGDGDWDVLRSEASQWYDLRELSLPVYHDEDPDEAPLVLRKWPDNAYSDRLERPLGREKREEMCFLDSTHPDFCTLRVFLHRVHDVYCHLRPILHIAYMVVQTGLTKEAGEWTVVGGKEQMGLKCPRYNKSNEVLVPRMFSVQHAVRRFSKQGVVHYSTR